MQRRKADIKDLRTFDGVWLSFIGLLVLAAIFYFEAYFSVSPYLPSSIPVHHDDYSNYARGGDLFQWSWNRPLSTYVIYLLSGIGPDWLIGAVRFLTVLFVLLSWVLLSQVTQLRHHWLIFLAFGITVLSAPIIAEYARYTGMITHLISGCLGFGAASALFRAAIEYEHGRSGRGFLWLSVLLLVLSSLAKEDFILFYAMSLVYAALRWPSGKKDFIGLGAFGLLTCGILIAASKLWGASSFLGAGDPAAPYYLNLAPGSVIETVWRYLLGAGVHGKLIAGTFVLTTLVAIGLAGIQREIPRTAYFILATLTLIAPYSVLPNHVNAYYGLIWIPMVAAAAVTAAFELSPVLFKFRFWRAAGPIIAVLLFALIFSFAGHFGRSSIAGWYDARAKTNAKVFAMLNEKRERINIAKAACIRGADAFSPWFMHDARYLQKVMGLDAIWYVLSSPTSPNHGGFVSAAAGSRGRTQVVISEDSFIPGCLQLNLEEKP